MTALIGFCRDPPAIAGEHELCRARGYRLVRAPETPRPILAYVETRADTHLRTETAMAWAIEPTGDHPSGWASQRLSLVRGFAGWGWKREAGSGSRSDESPRRYRYRAPIRRSSTQPET